MMKSRGIRRGDLFRVLLRSFLLQASWSFDRMQSLGFAFAIRPALRRLYPGADEYNSRLRLHMEYFNTQPYLASFILGAAVRMEEERAAGSGGTADVPVLKNNLMAPLGALGDSFFWGALKPLAALIAVSLLMAGAGWAPVLFLAVYNAWHLRLRTKVLFWGYQSGGDVVRLLSHYSFTRMASLFKMLSLAVLGGMLGMIPIWRPEFKPLPGAAGVVAGVAATLVLVFAARKGFSPVKLMLGLAAISLVLTYAGVA